MDERKSVERQHADHERGDRARETAQEPTAARVVDPSCSATESDDPDEEPNHRHEAENADLQQDVQPLVVEDGRVPWKRWVALRRDSGGESFADDRVDRELVPKDRPQGRYTAASNTLVLVGDEPP